MANNRRKSREGDTIKSSRDRDKPEDTGTSQREDKEPRTFKTNGKSYGIKLDAWQERFLVATGDKILCCGRQVGKTEVCAIDAGEYAIHNPKTKPIVMVAPTERQAFSLFTKTLNFLLKNYPQQVIVRGKDRPTKKRICLKSGVELYCLPVGKDGLGVRFLTIGRLYKDECSRIPELVHEAIDPALLTTGGDEILLSTPAGSKGTFYEVWINKDKAYDSFKRFSITSEKVVSERPICESWTAKQREKALSKLKQAKSRWSWRRYAQEYLGEFVSGLFRWFSDDLISNQCLLDRRKTLIHDRDYWMGCDIARLGEDEGTYEIFDKISQNRIEQVESIITRKQLTTQTEDRIVYLDTLWNFRQIGIDAGAGTLGVSIMDHLLRVPQVRKKVKDLNNARRIIDRNGTTVRLFKEDLYDNFRSLMEHGVLFLLNDPDVIESLRSIHYEYVIKEGEPSKLKIFGDYSHIVEGMIRAVHLLNQKNLNTYIDWV